MDPISSKVVFSAVQPTGALTIGNYIGAISKFKDLQDDHHCLFSVADLHSITVPQVPKNLRQRTYEVFSTFLSAGVDPKKSVVFVQSHVSAHAELSWILCTISYIGQLNRMTQFKVKSQKNEENLNAGLFTYPVLMAADILLYQTDFVPIGEDQKQHLELARDLAMRFNSRYSDTFKIPEPLISQSGGKIFSLKDPDKKMSKSDDDLNASIYLNDDDNTMRRKIRKAVTDSSAHFAYNDEQKGLKNLINILCIVTGKTPEEIVQLYEGKPYTVFKEDLGDQLVAYLKPFKDRFKMYMDDKAQLDQMMRDGAEKASYLARKTLNKVHRKIGLLPLK